MRNLLLTGLTLVAASAFAEGEVNPVIVEEVYGFKMTPDGNALMTQDYFGSALVYFINTGEQIYYNSYYPGIGNCLSSNGLAVGQSMANSLAAILNNGKGIIPPTLADSYMSSLDGITPDGTRACGYIANLGSSIIDVPMYVDIDEDANVSEPVILPYPSRDFLGTPPQFCTAIYISEDGKTMAGIVRDNRGFYTYPIVYYLKEDGNWDFKCPSEPLFNPNNYPIPQWPHDNVHQPSITEYMTEEGEELWNDAWDAYEASEGEGVNPWDELEVFMTPEDIDEYYADLVAYQEELKGFYAQIDSYWDDYSKIINGSNFQSGIFAMNPEGTLLAMSCGISEEGDNGATDTYYKYHLYVFDLKNDTFRKIESPINTAAPCQIFNDGTIVMVTNGTYVDYIILPDSEEFIPFGDYIASTHPEYLPWLQENLGREMTVIDPETGNYVNQEVIVGGVLSFSEDMSVMAGGFYSENPYTYIFGGPQSGVETVVDEIEDHYVVYNLQGLKIMETNDKSKLNNLGKGIFIINGKKVLL